MAHTKPEVQAEYPHPTGVSGTTEQGAVCKHTQSECTREEEEEQRAPTAPTPPQAGPEPSPAKVVGQVQGSKQQVQPEDQERSYLQHRSKIQPGRRVKKPGEPAAVLSRETPPAQLKQEKVRRPGPELKWSCQTNGQGLRGWGPRGCSSGQLRLVSACSAPTPAFTPGFANRRLLSVPHNMLAQLVEGKVQM